MKRKCLVLAIFFYVAPLISACIEPVSGDRVWNLAEAALATINTIESKVCLLLSGVDADFSGTFTVMQELLQKLCTSESLAAYIASSFDELVDNVPIDISKACVIESKLNPLITQVEEVDLDGTFTALEELKTVICNKLEQVSIDLGLIETEISLITQSEVEYAATISSQLKVLQTDVDMLNSALDNIDLVTGIDGIDSCVDQLTSLVNDLELDVCNLQNDIFYGFAGTFTALDAQLNLVTNISSLIDIAQAQPVVDFSGVYTSLEQLETTVCQMESLVDIVTLIVARIITCDAGSKIDLSESKICLAQQEVAPLLSLSDIIISKLESVSISEFDELCSELEQLVNVLVTIESKIDTIESKIADIDISSNISKLEVVSEELLSIESSLDQLDAMTSKLCRISSEVDQLIIESLTIESIIDGIDNQVINIESSIDALSLISEADLLESKLSVILPDTLTISSELDTLISSLDRTQSKIDRINANALSSAIDINTSFLDILSTDSLLSKLCLIEKQIIGIDSKMAFADSLISGIHLQAQELIYDFQETWTILDSINAKEMASISNLDYASSKLSRVNVAVDLSGVYTVIDNIINKEITVNSKVDRTISLIDKLSASTSTLDFSSIYTALNALNNSVNTVGSRTDVLNSKVNVLETYCGIPIYNTSLPLVITTSGRYFFAESLVYTPAIAGTNAITIATSNVTLDLNSYDISQSNGQLGTAQTKAIVINSGLSNIRIENGSVHDFSSKGISFNSNCSNILVYRVSVSDVGLVIGTNFLGDNGIDFNSNCSEIILDSCLVKSSVNDTVNVTSSMDVVLRNCDLLSGVQSGCVMANTSNLFVEDCRMLDISNSSVILRDNSRNFLIENCIIERGLDPILQSAGITIESAFRGTIKNNIIASPNPVDSSSNNAILCSGVSKIEMIANVVQKYNKGLLVNAGSADLCILRNRFMQNNSNVDEISGGPNTYLGNFAFNSTAVGNPNNTNYRISGSSNIGGKFVTASARGSFGDRPKYWHNINMLP